MTQKGKLSALKDHIRTFTEKTSLHGLQTVGDSMIWAPRRIFWGLAIVINICLVCIQGGTLLKMAINPDTQTSTYIDPGTIPIPVPALTICNKNRYRKSVTTRWDLVGYPDYQRVIAHQIDHMVLGCSKGNLPIQNCTALFKQVMTDKGVCYTFNYDPNNTLYIEYGGVFLGYHFLFNVEEEEYANTISGAVGFQVLVHGQEEIPLVENYGFSVSPGEETLIALTRKRVLQDDRMDCLNTSDPSFQNPLLYYPVYTKGNCQIECYTVEVEKLCNCTPDVYKGSKRVCLYAIDEDAACLQNITENFKHITTQCCSCLPLCDSLVHQVKLSHARFPAKSGMDSMQYMYNINKSELSANLARVVIFYETENIETAKVTYSYDFSRLFGDLGGYMGLMLGASILSLAEVLDMLGQLLVKALSPDMKKTTPVEKF